MSKIFSLTEARSLTQNTPKNQAIKRINDAIKNAANAHCNRVNILLNYDVDINKINTSRGNRVYLEGDNVFKLLPPELKEAFAEFEQEGYGIKYAGCSSYNASTYEEGWDHNYAAYISW